MSVDTQKKTCSIQENDVCYQKVSKSDTGEIDVGIGDKMKEEEEENELFIKKNSFEYVPPDGGWGWLVLFGSMLVNILVPGTVKSFGVLFVEFLEVFEATPAAAAWIPALCYFLYSSLGPISSILSVKYSYRTVTVLGGTFAAVGMILSFWAQSVSYLYISYGILVGTGAGLSFPPTVYIVTSYFVRLRGLANGLCISGSAIGSIILPPILRYLLENFGYRGAVLIMGGVTLNVWVGAMFYHPVEQHMVKVAKEEGSDSDENSSSNKMIDNNYTTTTSSSSSHNLNSKIFPKSIESGGTNNKFIKSASSVAVENYNNRERKISMPSSSNKELRSQTILKNQIHSSPTLHIGGGTTAAKVIPANRSFDVYTQSRLSSRQQKSSAFNNRVPPPHRSPSTSSFQYVSTPYHGSTLSALHPEQFASSLTLRSISFSPVSSSSSKKGKKNNTTTTHQQEEEERNKYFDVTLLKDPLYLVILISNSTNAISYTNFIILLPSYAIMLGFDKSMAAWLISIVSALDLVGRIGGSALSDTELIQKKWYFIGGLLVSGIALALLPLAASYTMLSVACAVFGLASGVYVGVTAVIMADMLGTERLTSTYGISLFVNGILQLIGPPLCGLWFQQSGTYVPLFTTLGIVLIIGATIWAILPFINRNKNNNNKQNHV